MGIVFITSKGQPLIWGAQETSSERSRTEDVIRHIEQLMDEANKQKINIKAFVSDSAGEYAAARWVKIKGLNILNIIFYLKYSN